MKTDTSKTTRITIVRHGTTSWMEQGIIHGRLDAPLSERGIQEVQKTANALQGRIFDAFYSSPSGRAMQTAQIIGDAVHMEPAPLDGLMEHNFGAIEGTVPTWTMSRYRMLRTMILGWVIPPWKDGESFRENHHRVKQTFRVILSRHPGGRILIVTHHGVINVILRIMSKRYLKFFHIAPAMAVEIEIDENGKGSVLTNV